MLPKGAFPATHPQSERAPCHPYNISPFPFSPEPVTLGGSRVTGLVLGHRLRVPSTPRAPRSGILTSLTVGLGLEDRSGPKGLNRHVLSESTYN